jgi:uncharacterized protein (DUF2225 family)
MATTVNPPEVERWQCPWCEYSGEATDTEDIEQHQAEHFEGKQKKPLDIKSP